MENEERLRLSEDNFLESNLKGHNYDNGYVFGVYDGDIEQFINRYVAVNICCSLQGKGSQKGHHFGPHYSTERNGICRRIIVRNTANMVNFHKSNLML